MKKNNFNKSYILFLVTTFIAICVTPISVSAEVFFRSGTITRTLSDTSDFGGCMVHLSSNFSNGCPNNGWVSFDCAGTYSRTEDGKRAYASALVAFSLGKQVSISVNNELKINGYCVAKRIDIIQ